MATRGAFAGLLSALLGMSLSVGILSGCSTEAKADFRSATSAEISPPPGALDRLSKELGAKFSAPDVTMVDAAIASSAAEAITQTEYGAQTAGSVPSQYLQAATGLLGLKGSQSVWIVIYANLEIPVLAPGGAKSDAVIRNIYVLISSDTGAFINAVYTD
jgi:hypothetical protein